MWKSSKRVDTFAGYCMLIYFKFLDIHKQSLLCINHLDLFLHLVLIQTTNISSTI